MVEHTVYINSYPLNFMETFMLILPSKDYYFEGDMFHFHEWYKKESGESFLFTKYMVSKETKTINELSDCETYLSKNCDKKMFYQIIKNQYKSRLTQYKLDLLPEHKRVNLKVGSLYSFIDKETLVDVMVFTSKECIKSMYEPNVLELEQNSMLSCKPVISKNYCHKSKWNYAQQRPYTDDELKQLGYD